MNRSRRKGKPKIVLKTQDKPTSSSDDVSKIDSVTTDGEPVTRRRSSRNNTLMREMKDKVTTVDNSSTFGAISKNVNKAQDIDVSEVTNETVLPCFVPDGERNACFLKECNFIAPSAVDLLVHVLHHHKDITCFKCPHCPNDCAFPIVKIVNHLAMHDRTLYKCNLCAFYHPHCEVVGDHIKRKHLTCQVDVKEVRNFKDKSNDLKFVKSEAKVSSEENEERNAGMTKKWQCGFCDSYSPKMLAHAKYAHNIKYQFKCTMCLVRIPNKHYVDIHCSICHPDTVLTLVAFYYQVGSTLPIQEVEVIMPDGQIVFSPENATFVHKIPGTPLMQYFDVNCQDEVDKRNKLENCVNEEPKDNGNKRTGERVESPATAENADNSAEAAEIEKSLNVEKQEKADECVVVRDTRKRSRNMDDDVTLVSIRRSMRINVDHGTPES